MPRIFDNMEQSLLPALQETLQLGTHADFCVGYFNLRGWKLLDSFVDNWPGGPGNQCRLLVGMQRLPRDDMLQLYSLSQKDQTLDQATAVRLKRKLAEEFRDQLTRGAPTDEDEAGLRRLAAQLKAGKLVVKLFLKHQLHAKLYLCFRPDPINPRVGYVGSSNLTLAGLSHQGELNVDVLDQDATEKLALWFENRWNDRWCLDISKELVQIIEESWARTDVLPPYFIYVKMAYHLAEEARAGLSEFTIPAEFRNTLLDFQAAAVKIAARHLEKRDGVIIGDVVGLGKTLMATALARVYQDPPHSLETLIICPKNLVGMWESYAANYRLLGKVVSISQTRTVLPELRRYRIVLIDESHNLRNREGKTYAVIRDYIERNNSRCILLSATPYNKSYLDLANQIRLFLSPDRALGISPEEYIRQQCDNRIDEFTKKHQCAVNCLAAFEKSEYPDDWRELMRLFMVRRTRSFIQRNYAYSECIKCGNVITATQSKCSSCGEKHAPKPRQFLVLEDQSRFYFPERQPRTLKFRIADKDPNDQYARLYSENVVDTIRLLHLPRYGLGNYVRPSFEHPPSPKEDKVLSNLSRAGKRLLGFCRTNLFKRLESSGSSFLESVKRHILRNFIHLHAIESGADLPIGTQDAALFDTRDNDEDQDSTNTPDDLFNGPSDKFPNNLCLSDCYTLDDFRAQAAQGYGFLKDHYRNRFDWLRPDLFVEELASHLRQDAERLYSVLQMAGEWNPDRDSKLAELYKMVTATHGQEKVLVFSQFADTVNYLSREMSRLGVSKVAGVTGDTDDPSAFACRFSPVSNQCQERVPSSTELRILISTDVLSEGQNLQDAAIIVNYDLPWAIIRLVQRAGRIDRIGQHAEQIQCYSFLPADGVESLIRLRARIRQRLHENAEVVGSDESFFEDENHDNVIRDLFTEKSGILDDPEDNEVDLASQAYQIWKNAIDQNPSLKKTIPELSNVVFSTKPYLDTPTTAKVGSSLKSTTGIMVYVRTSDGNDALAWLDEEGRTVTESQHEILRAAACEPDTPGLTRLSNHHELVRKGLERLATEQRTDGGQLGRPSSARRRVYERLKDYADRVHGTLFDIQPLHRAIEAIYARPFQETAREMLNRELRGGITDEKLVEFALTLYEEDRLCIHEEEVVRQEPQIICSLGIRRE
jgi:superfamily II DNA/RNA helicase